MATSIDLVNQAPEAYYHRVPSYGKLLHVGNLEVDEGWFKQGANASSLSNKTPTNARRKLIMLSMLIEHPTEGLILYETGGRHDYPEIIGPRSHDVFPRVDYNNSMDFSAQIALRGHSITDIKMVIISQLHLDYAGGLDSFRNTNIPIHVHELELKYAFYSVAKKSDLGAYLPHYLTFDLNWVPFHDDFYEIAPGLNLRHAPGHTLGLNMMQVNLKESGTWLFTSDQCHVKENYLEDMPQEWLARDHDAWCRSHQMVKGFGKRTHATVVLGHCWDTVRDLGLEFAPKAYR